MAKPFCLKQEMRMGVPLLSPNSIVSQEGRCVVISVRGKWLQVPAFEAYGQTIAVTGHWIKIAAVHDEEWQAGDLSSIVDHVIADLRPFRERRADLLTFAQKPTDPFVRHPYSYELVSVAAIPVTSYANWWMNRVSTDLRKDVRRAAKRGVIVRTVPFTDDFVSAVMRIYNETPIRQGRLFWHYGKSFEEVARANGTYLDRCEFVGAFIKDELIGFLKIVYVDRMARLMQILAKDSCREYLPMSSLIAKAVELAEARGCSLLTYGQYRYSQGPDGMTAFKHRNGFEEILVPRYYIPLTVLGRLFLLLRLHRDAKALIPNYLRLLLKRMRLIFSRPRKMRTDAE
jgi:hypothetical protein